MLPGRDDGRVVGALEVKLAPQVVGDFAVASGGEAGFPFGFGERGVDLAVVMGLIGAGAGGEVGQLAQEHVKLHGAAANGNGLHPGSPACVCGVA